MSKLTDEQQALLAKLLAYADEHGVIRFGGISLSEDEFAALIQLAHAGYFEDTSHPLEIKIKGGEA